jgi:hypothetical protein
LSEREAAAEEGTSAAADPASQVAVAAVAVAAVAVVVFERVTEAVGVLVQAIVWWRMLPALLGARQAGSTVDQRQCLGVVLL